MLGQPKHAAAMSYEQSAGGAWHMAKAMWIAPAYFTVGVPEAATDDVAGAVKTRQVSKQLVQLTLLTLTLALALTLTLTLTRRPSTTWRLMPTP